MTDFLDMNVETLGKTFRMQASRMRLLAATALPGDFKSRLLAVAQDYDRQAEKFEQNDAHQP